MNRLEEIEETLSMKHNYSSSELEQIMPRLGRIDELRKEKNAILLAHYYQIPPIQLIADFKGDSLYLAQKARELEGSGLVVCSTVVFMAEMVKLLSPNKKVVVPNLEAGCSIAEGINGEAVMKIREAFPNSGIVAYVNTYADTKAEIDVVCTSSNAEDIVLRTGGDPIILLPDYYFAKNIFKGLEDKRGNKTYLAYKGKSGSRLILEDVYRGEEHYVDSGEVLPILDKGTCIVHEQFSRGQVEFLRRKDDIDVVMSHPEVNPDVAEVSDFVGGTAKMIEYVAQHREMKRFLVISECDLTAPLIERFPDRDFVTPCILCQYMKKNSLDGVINSMREEKHEIQLESKTVEGARKSLDRMFEITTA